MVKKFVDFIEEGMWAKGFERARTGVERIEDKISNIKDLKEVDLGLPFNFSNICLSVNNETKFKWNDVESLIPLIKKNGWRLPYIEELDHYINDTSIKYKDINQREVEIFSTKTNQKLHVWLGTWFCSQFWCGDHKVWKINNGRYGTSSLFDKSHSDNDEFEIILVKDKKVNEGMWAKGFERARTGEERIENKIQSNINSLKEIDLGVVKIADEDVEIDGEEIFTYYDMIKYKPYIEKQGWKILDFDTLWDIIYSFDINCTPYDDKLYLIKNKNTGEEVFIPRHVEWWVDNTDVKRRKKIAEEPNSTYGNTLTTITHIDYNVKTKYALLPIRLIRK